MASDLTNRYMAAHREAIEQLERTAAAENHWLIYALVGLEHMAACGVSHYLSQVRHMQHPRWLYVLVWLTQILATWATIKLVSGRPTTDESPLEPVNKRIWTVFILLCINIAVLNVVAGEPIFLFMPALATLSSFGFTFLTTLVSRRFMAAGLAMFVTGILMARFEKYAFLIYGAGWLAILESLGVVLWMRSGSWRTTVKGSTPRDLFQAAPLQVGGTAGAALDRHQR